MPWHSHCVLLLGVANIALYPVGSRVGVRTPVKDPRLVEGVECSPETDCAAEGVVGKNWVFIVDKSVCCAGTRRKNPLM